METDTLTLRDIEATLSANASKLYAMGFRSAVKRSTSASAAGPVICTPSPSPSAFPSSRRPLMTSHASNFQRSRLST
jgi:hypothetical protein